MGSDREELIALRISMARVAQSLGVDNVLNISEDGYPELYRKASTIERGWNDLAFHCAAKAQSLLMQA